MNKIGQLSVEEFLRDYWQKKPVLLKNVYPDFECPIDPDEIAGLSLEEDVESRMIFENGENHAWELKNGPFTEASFSQLPKEKWTLLVQGVDQWIPEVADLLDDFCFLPSWRRDDIMVSFAPKGGSVGPHYDHYDVFLLQASGQRKWQVGPKCNAQSPTVENTPLRILQEMEVTEEWIVEPGDVLYVPPMYAHNGVAENDCLTFSVGFRAPSENEILQSFTDFLSVEASEETRYSDPDVRDSSDQPALIDQDSIERFKSILNNAVSDAAIISSWIGCHMTESKYPDLHQPLEEPLDWDELAPALSEATHLTKNEMSRLAYTEEDNGIKLFGAGLVIGLSYHPSTTYLAKLIANNRHIDMEVLLPLLEEPACQNLLLDLINGNHVYLDELETDE